MLHWAPSPVGQLRDAATSLITAGTDAQSGICCALVLSCAAVTQSSFVDTSCASCCVSPPPSLLHLQALTAAAEGKFHVVKAGWIFFFLHHGTERRHSACGAAARQYGVRLQPVRRGATAGTERAPPRGWNSSHSGDQGASAVETKSFSTAKVRIFLQLTIFIFSGSSPLLSLSRTRLAALLRARWTGVGHLTWWESQPVS